MLDPNGFNLELEPTTYVHEDVRPRQTPHPTPTLEEAMAYYTTTQGKLPFRLYKPWYDFAVARQCNVLGAAHLSKLLDHVPKQITQQMIDDASAMPNTDTLFFAPLKSADDPHAGCIDDGWANESGFPLESPNYVIQNTNIPGEPDNNWQSWMGPFARWFPRNFRMVVNGEDWPRIFVPGKVCSISDTQGNNDAYASTVSSWLKPSNLTFTDAEMQRLADMDGRNPFTPVIPNQFRKRHAYFVRNPLPGYLMACPVPIFSQATIPGCYADILVPLLYPMGTFGEELPPGKRGGADLPFGNKVPVAVWRGSTTGAEPTPADPRSWNRLHRHRLVKYSQDLFQRCQKANGPCVSPIDARFHGWVQMQPDAVTEHVRVFGNPSGNFLSYEQQFYHRFLLDVDGNSFSRRFHAFLRDSKSLVLRARGFVEWIDHWAIPYVHYIPVKLDWSDLLSAVEWAMWNPESAERIAKQGHEFGRSSLRLEDIQCHMFAVLAEYEDRLVGRGNLAPIFGHE
ncbi:glycosyltransferase family 90 protein [Gonapodya prolifera JEL478]|uniref:Glycosyltransferase family 90 protein n=1 Tax=Gonapodya prolifera (strain JEL478) TaxID=1344416 RepID=A0A139AZ71_GONPJ|nr:glycosyltransferase family 90 protein [Gonapodya prolifera JEL478]|eukprot:KXS22048.1 glycosyltransferase family 90 protein [Gonapodya prolifera JEL478]